MKELAVTILQNDLHWENPEANLAKFEEQIWSHGQKSDLIILPEMFTTGFSMEARLLAEPANSRTFRWMQQQAAQHQAVVSGSYILQQGGQYYNRFYAVYPDGSFVHYDKRHLFALAGEDKPYTAGSNRVVFEVRGWRILPLICYDLRFPVWARQGQAPGYEYDMLIYVANWPKPRIHAWDTLLQARAIENLSYCIGVNRVGVDGTGADYPGHSNVYDYLGAPLITGRDGIFAETVQLDYDAMARFRERFPFDREADAFKIG